MPDRFLPIASLLVACAVVFVQSRVLAPWMLDDAFIFFRYAENWAGGAGLLFNAGEPPVEGYTSFLWLGLLTLAAALGADLVDAALVLGHAAVVGTLVLVSQGWRWLPGFDRRQAAVATLFLGTCAAFTTWARSGMETALQALLVAATAIVYLRVKDRPGGIVRFAGIGVLFALLGMNRPDGLLIVAVLACDACLCHRRLGWRAITVTAAVFLVVFGSYYAWRCAYFGYPVPNTFYAKVGATGSQVWRGFGYVWAAKLTLAPLLLLLAAWIGLALAKRGWSRDGRGWSVLPVLVVVYTVYLVAVGGDVMPAQRFFTPLVPLLCLLGARVAWAARGRWRWALVGPTVAYGVLAMSTWIVEDIRADVVAYNGEISGRWLRENAPPGSTVATNTAGSVVYYSGLRAIDMLGLNDLHIAHVEMSEMGKGFAGHEKGDGEYVFARNPEFVQLGSSVGWLPLPQTPVPPFPTGRQLWSKPEFQQRYKLLYRDGDTRWPGGRPLGKFGFWVRADVHEKLERGR